MSDTKGNNGLNPSVPDFQYILRLVKRILPNGYDHESIASELVCEAIARNRPTSFTSVRNFCVDQMRRRRSELYANEACVSRSEQRRGHSSDTQTADSTLAAILGHARLSGTDRTILIHKFWLGRSDAEIAVALNLPSYRVTELRNQALDKLRTVARELYPREE